MESSDVEQEKNYALDECWIAETDPGLCLQDSCSKRIYFIANAEVV